MKIYNVIQESIVGNDFCASVFPCSSMSEAISTLKCKASEVYKKRHYCGLTEEELQTLFHIDNREDSFFIEDRNYNFSEYIYIEQGDVKVSSDTPFAMMVSKVIETAKRELERGDSETISIILNAYNFFQEGERDGVDYIFNIDNTDDVTCCMNGGMTTEQVVELWTGSRENHSKYFYYGCNYPNPVPISSVEELCINLISWLDEFIPDVIRHPFFCTPYQRVYEKYITNEE